MKLVNICTTLFVALSAFASGSVYSATVTPSYGNYDIKFTVFGDSGNPPPNVKITGEFAYPEIVHLPATISGTIPEGQGIIQLGPFLDNYEYEIISSNIPCTGGPYMYCGAFGGDPALAPAIDFTVEYTYPALAYNWNTFTLDVTGGIGYLSTPQYGPGGVEYLGPLVLGEWSWALSGPANDVAAVPLPAAASLMLSGLGMFGFAARRRHRKTAVV